MGELADHGIMQCKSHAFPVTTLCFLQAECCRLGTQATFRQRFKILHTGYHDLTDDLSNVIEIFKAACHIDPGQRMSPEGLLANANVLALKAAHHL